MELETMKMTLEVAHKAWLQDADTIAKQADEIKSLKTEIERLTLLTTEREHPVTTILMQAYGNIELDARTEENNRLHRELCNVDNENHYKQIQINDLIRKKKLAYCIIDKMWRAFRGLQAYHQVAMALFDGDHPLAWQIGWSEPDESDASDEGGVSGIDADDLDDDHSAYSADTEPGADN